MNETVWVDCFYYAFELPRKTYALYRVNASFKMPELVEGSEGKRAVVYKDVSNVLLRERAIRRVTSYTAFSIDENLSLN